MTPHPQPNQPETQDLNFLTAYTQAPMTLATQRRLRTQKVFTNVYEYNTRETAWTNNDNNAQSMTSTLYSQ